MNCFCLYKSFYAHYFKVNSVIMKVLMWWCTCCVACQKIVQQRLSSSASCLTPTNSRPSTPSSNHFTQQPVPAPRHTHHSTAAVPSPTNNGFSSSSPHTSAGSLASNTLGNASPSHNVHSLSHKVSACLPFFLC